MTFQEILQLIDLVTKLLAALKDLGVNLSGVQLHTSAPVDLIGLASLITTRPTSTQP